MHPDPRSLFVNIIRHHANNMQKKKEKEKRTHDGYP